jgi:SPOR domain
MRNLFLALVLVNLGFAAWHSWFASPGPMPVAAPVAATPGIMLVSEVAVEVTDEPAFEAEPEPTPAVAAADRCISVGPFRELSQAAAAAASLRSAGYDPSQRVAEGDIWVGYWVYLPGIPTREAANETLAILQENKISDSYVTPADVGYLISLGVFSEVARAGRRREEVRRLGFDPTVVDRTRRGTVYWIDVMLGPEQTLDLNALQTPGRITRLEQRNCESASP